MSRLRAALKAKFAERKDDIQIYAPRNVETVRLKFRGERMAKVRLPTFHLSARAETDRTAHHFRRLSVLSHLPHPLHQHRYPVSSSAKTSPTLSSPHPTSVTSPD